MSFEVFKRFLVCNISEIERNSSYKFNKFLPWFWDEIEIEETFFTSIDFVWIVKEKLNRYLKCLLKVNLIIDSWWSGVAFDNSFVVGSLPFEEVGAGKLDGNSCLFDIEFECAIVDGEVSVHYYNMNKTNSSLKWQ